MCGAGLWGCAMGFSRGACGIVGIDARGFVVEGMTAGLLRAGVGVLLRLWGGPLAMRGSSREHVEYVE